MTNPPSFPISNPIRPGLWHPLTDVRWHRLGVQRPHLPQRCMCAPLADSMPVHPHRGLLRPSARLLPGVRKRPMGQYRRGIYTTTLLRHGHMCSYRRSYGNRRGAPTPRGAAVVGDGSRMDVPVAPFDRSTEAFTNDDPNDLNVRVRFGDDDDLERCHGVRRPLGEVNAVCCNCVAKLTIVTSSTHSTPVPTYLMYTPPHHWVPHV